MRLPRWFVCSADASGCVPGQHRTGRPGGREGPGAGAERGEDTRSRAGRARDGALQVGRLIAGARKRTGKYTREGGKAGSVAHATLAHEMETPRKWISTKCRVEKNKNIILVIVVE